VKFVCLGYIEEEALLTRSAEEMQAFMDGCFDFDDELRRNGHFVGGAALYPPRTAKTFRYRHGKPTATDGPFAETKEQLGGIMFFEADSMEDAVRLMEGHPGNCAVGGFEIRPLADLSEFIAASEVRRGTVTPFSPEEKELIANTKAGFERTKARLDRLFAATPDDRVAWAPSSTARSAAQVVAHAAWAVGNIHRMLMGTRFAEETTEEAERSFREQERDIKTREAAQSLFDSHAAAFLAWLDTMTPADLRKNCPLPFGMGEMPVSGALGFPAMHTDGHLAQLEYIQTIYGDSVWH